MVHLLEVVILRYHKKIPYDDHLRSNVFGFQARNNARILISGSLSMFSNRLAGHTSFFCHTVKLTTFGFNSGFSDLAYRNLEAIPGE